MTTQMQITAKQRQHLRKIASQGGNATVAKHGKEYMSKIASQGGKALVAKHGVDYMRQLGLAGAKAFHAKYMLIPVELAQFAIVNRATNECIGFLSGTWLQKAVQNAVQDPTIPF